MKMFNSTPCHADNMHFAYSSVRSDFFYFLNINVLAMLPIEYKFHFIRKPMRSSLSGLDFLADDWVAIRIPAYPRRLEDSELLRC